MATREARRRSRPAARAGRTWWLIALAGVLLLAAAGVLLKMPRGGPDEQTPAAVAAAKIIGNPTATIEVEEWGDFQ